MIVPPGCFRCWYFEMPKRQEFLANSFYHVYNRWRYKQELFHDWKDFQRFLWYIDIYKEKCKDDIWLIAYSILPNHFHFVIYCKSDSYKLSYFIWNICASYVRYYKAKYTWDKWISFFESRFKAKLLDSEEYLNQCVHYVEFNALKHWIVDDINQRPFTSFDKIKLNTPYDEILALDWEFS